MEKPLTEVHVCFMCQNTTRANLHHDFFGVIKTSRQNMKIRTVNRSVFTNVGYSMNHTV